MQITRVGVDIAKSVFHLHAVNCHDARQWEKKLKREEWIASLVERVPTEETIAMESCASAHHWARELQRRGYRVKLIAAQFVKPYVKSNRNDRVDAEPICEAAGRGDFQGSCPSIYAVRVHGMFCGSRRCAFRSIRIPLQSRRLAERAVFRLRSSNHAVNRYLDQAAPSEVFESDHRGQCQPPTYVTH